MIAHIYKPKRRKNGKQVVARLYWAKVRLNGEAKIACIPLHVSDKQVAKQKLDAIVREMQQEAAGIIAPKPLRDGAQRPLAGHLDDYVADLEAKGRDAMYVYNVGKRVAKLLKECGWQYPKDVTADGFVAWRAKQTKAAKTKNEYLDASCGLLNWMKGNGRLLANPLACVGKVQVQGNEVRQRRAFTNDEMQRLLSVAGPRKVVYLTAVNTGLRRAELAALEKGDVHLYGDNPFIKVRASTTKNHKGAVIWLNEELATALRELVRPGECGNERVFASIPSMEEFRIDLQAAGIPFEDGQGRRADFHSLRHTLSTNLARAGVAPRVAMELMRHSDMRLTNKTYTDATLLPMVEAVEKLPVFSGGANTQRGTQNSVPAGHSVSLPVTDAFKANSGETIANIGVCHALSFSVTEGQTGGLVPRLGLEPRTN